MKTSIYVAELAYIKRKPLSEDTPVIDPTENTGPSPGPNPATDKKEKPAPDSAVKPKDKPNAQSDKPNAQSDKPSAQQQAFAGGALSDVGAQIIRKVYGVVSGDIYHSPQGRVGNNPAYTGAGTGR